MSLSKATFLWARFTSARKWKRLARCSFFSIASLEVTSIPVMKLPALFSYLLLVSRRPGRPRHLTLPFRTDPVLFPPATPFYLQPNSVHSFRATGPHRGAVRGVSPTLSENPRLLQRSLHPFPGAPASFLSGALRVMRGPRLSALAPLAAFRDLRQRRCPPPPRLARDTRSATSSSAPAPRPYREQFL